MNEGANKFYAFLTYDEAAFRRRYYPDLVDAVEPSDGYNPPRDIATITLPEAATLMGMTRQGAWRLALTGVFESLRKVGPPTAPIYLLDVREVLERVEARGDQA